MVRDGCPTQRALAGSHRRSLRAQGRRQVTQKACAERPTSVVDAAPEVWSAVHANRPSSAPERKSSQRNRKSASQLVSPKLRSPAGYDLSELPEAGKFDADPPFCRSSVTISSHYFLASGKGTSPKFCMFFVSCSTERREGRERGNFVRTKPSFAHSETRTNPHFRGSLSPKHNIAPKNETYGMKTTITDKTSREWRHAHS